MNIKSLMALIVAMSAGSALANQATVVNLSPQPLTFKYVIAQQNRGKPASFIGPFTTVVQKESEINFGLNNYTWAGIVPISINGHVLPTNVTTFNTDHRCSLTTDNHKTFGNLLFTTTKHEVGCSVKGGIFQ